MRKIHKHLVYFLSIYGQDQMSEFLLFKEMFCDLVQLPLQCFLINVSTIILKVKALDTKMSYLGTPLFASNNVYGM